VVRIADGDSFTVSRSGSSATTEIRIFGIDAPERSQPWSRRAREALSERVYGKVVRVVPVERDRHRRIVAEVHAHGASVGEAQVREGHAWVFRRYTESTVLLALEAEAKAAKRGLWSLPERDRVPPWEWRDGKRAGQPAADLSAAGFRCGGKTYCREMTSCAEARFFLERCGLARLDGDADGVPCETLCTAAR
jgi:endonuclease YncB( thermonuclease family)